MSRAATDPAGADDRDDVRPLSPAERTRLLARLRLPAEPPSLRALARLQWAWLRALPFHNIELLAGRAGHHPPVDVEAAIDRALRGVGGPCHVHAASFLALARALGYDAHLAAATIGAPGDHLVVIARIDGEGYACDVGNGHPYPQPFPLSKPLAFQRFGWSFSTSVEPGRLVLRRRLGPDEHKIVYRLDTSPRRFADFTDIIERHHHTPGFGPFLVGLRAVRITERVMLTLRDALYQRHTDDGPSERPVESEAAARALLEGPFDLGTLPIEAAFAALRAAGHAPWPEASAPVRGGARRATRVLVSLSTTDRPDSLGRLVHGLVDELERRGYGGWPAERPVELLIVENSASATNQERNRRIGAAIRARGLSVEWIDDGVHGRPIGESRLRQTEAIRARRRRGAGDEAWWMIDDDLEIGQLRLDAGGVLRAVSEIDYFAAIDRYRHERPEIGVVLGGVTGDPPIRPEAVLRVQLFDVLANLEWFGALSPDQPYRLASLQSGFHLSDYYYDHRRDGGEHLFVPFLWLPRGRDHGRVVDEMEAFLDELPLIAHGRAITRPLLVGTRALPDRERPGCRRGGNTIFLDPDALLAHPYPSFPASGVTTRRSDMIGAALLVARGGVRMVEASLPLLHRRVATASGTDAREEILASLIGEFYGVLIARCVMEHDPEQPISTEALAAMTADRGALVIARLRAAARLADRIAARLDERRGAWWEAHARTCPGLARLRDTLAALDRGILGGTTPAAREAWFARVEAELLSPARIVDLARAVGALKEEHG